MNLKWKCLVLSVGNEDQKESKRLIVTAKLEKAKLPK